MITLNVVIQSDDQIFVVWTTPPSVQNQSLSYFDVTVQGLSTANQYYREQRQYYVRGQTTSSTLTFNGLGKALHKLRAISFKKYIWLPKDIQILCMVRTVHV